MNKLALTIATSAFVHLLPLELRAEEATDPKFTHFVSCVSQFINEIHRPGLAYHFDRFKSDGIIYAHNQSDAGARRPFNISIIFDYDNLEFAVRDNLNGRLQHRVRANLSDPIYNELPRRTMEAIAECLGESIRDRLAMQRFHVFEELITPLTRDNYNRQNRPEEEPPQPNTEEDSFYLRRSIRWQHRYQQ